MLWFSIQAIPFGMYSSPWAERLGRCEEGKDE